MASDSSFLNAESRVYRPQLWLTLLVGSLFVSLGLALLLTLPQRLPAIPRLISLGMAAAFLCLGAVIACWSIYRFVCPSRIRHSAPDILSDVPHEPLVCEGSVVHGRVTHDLCETTAGWELRPASKLWRDDQRFFVGFGALCLIFFSTALAWIFHNERPAIGWFVAAVCGLSITIVCGGTVFFLMGMMARAGYRRLSKLAIRSDGSDLLLDLAPAPDTQQADFGEGLKWIFVGETERQQLAIPRERVVAVQLCAWKCVFATAGSRSMTWAVQGLLVVAPSDGTGYQRLPLLLTSDFVGAARLMQRVALVLKVPYLFCADKEDWVAEKRRAQERPPLRAGGWQT